jgi:hypothetical protein
MMRNALTGDGLRYQRTVVVNGNQLFAVVVNEWDGEIWSSHTTLSAPYIRPQPFSQPSVTPTLPPCQPSIGCHALQRRNNQRDSGKEGMVQATRY